MSNAATLPRPPGTTVAAFKGLAIAASLLSAGQLATISTIIPTLYPAAHESHRLAAQQFAHLYRTLKATSAPANLLAAVICAALAYMESQEHHTAGRWKLWAASGVAMVAQIPWALLFMETPSQKLLWVSEVDETATTTPRRSSGIGVRVIAASPERGIPGGRGPGLAGGSLLGVPRSGADGAITPMEEFEPYGDGPMDEREYVQLKVIDLLKTYNSYNFVRTAGALTAGLLALWAGLTT